MRKKTENKKNEILKIANELFLEKGFNNTSTNDIIEKVGITRGGLYHHFVSKESILNEIIEKNITKVIGEANKIANNFEIPVIERLYSTIMALNINHSSGMDLTNKNAHPQNALLHEKMQQSLIKSVPPILTKVILEGIELEIFNTPYPYESVEMIIVYIDVVLDNDLVPLSESQIASRVQAIIFNLERLLGAPEGSFLKAIEDYNKRRNTEKGV